MFDVICVGSSTMDVFTKISSKFSKVKVGDKVLIKEIEKHSGGGATNSAVSLAKLGLKVGCLSKVGDDHDGDFIINELEKEKVYWFKTKKSKRRTSLSIILSSKKEKDRIIYTYKGASDDLKWKDFSKTKFKTKWIYLATLLEKSFKTAKKIVDYAEKNGIKILFNPSSYLAEKGKSKLKFILKRTEVLILNKEEAKKLLRSKEDKIEILAKKLSLLGPKIVIVTQGPKELILYSERIIKAKPYPVKVIHTAGAGDAFNSGFLAGLIKNKDLVECLKMGMAQSASVIQHYGTKNKLLKWKEIQTFVKKKRVKVKDVS